MLSHVCTTIVKLNDRVSEEGSSIDLYACILAIDRFVVTLQLENTKLQERLKQFQDVVQPCSLSQTCGVSVVFWSSKYTIPKSLYLQVVNSMQFHI